MNWSRYRTASEHEERTAFERYSTNAKSVMIGSAIADITATVPGGTMSGRGLLSERSCTTPAAHGGTSLRPHAHTPLHKLLICNRIIFRGPGSLILPFCVPAQPAQIIRHPFGHDHFAPHKRPEMFAYQYLESGGLLTALVYFAVLVPLIPSAWIP